MAKQTNVAVKAVKSKKKGNPKGIKSSGPKVKPIKQYRGQGR